MQTHSVRGKSAILILLSPLNRISRRCKASMLENLICSDHLSEQQYGFMTSKAKMVAIFWKYNALSNAVNCS